MNNQVLIIRKITIFVIFSQPMLYRNVFASNYEFGKPKGSFTADQNTDCSIDALRVVAQNAMHLRCV